jgi:hypothetical protein
MTVQEFTYYPEIKIKGNSTRAIVSQVVYLLSKGLGISWELIYENLGVSEDQVYSALKSGKELGWFSWKRGNGNRRYDFKLLRKPSKTTKIHYSEKEFNDALGSHQQAACNRFLFKMCNGLMPTVKRLAGVLSCSERQAAKLKKSYTQSYQQPCTSHGTETAQVTEHPAQTTVLFSKFFSNNLVSKKDYRGIANNSLERRVNEYYYPTLKAKDG